MVTGELSNKAHRLVRVMLLTSMGEASSEASDLGYSVEKVLGARESDV
jgi:hypothetical protein